MPAINWLSKTYDKEYLQTLLMNILENTLAFGKNFNKTKLPGNLFIQNWISSNMFFIAYSKFRCPWLKYTLYLGNFYSWTSIQILGFIIFYFN